MAETPTLAPVVSFVNDASAVTTVNANNVLITTAFADCLSLAGTTPNAMLSNLDMNQQQIINLPAPSTINSPVRVVDVVSNPTLTVPPFLTGSGVPSATASKGTLYINLTATTTTTRLYINTTGSNVWASFTASA